MTRTQYNITLVLLCVAIVAAISALAYGMFGQQQNCHRANYAREQRTAYTHKPAHLLNCSLPFPEGAIGNQSNQ